MAPCRHQQWWQFTKDKAKTGLVIYAVVHIVVDVGGWLVALVFIGRQQGWW